MYRKTLTAAAATLAATVGFAATAGAALPGSLTFDQTYPVASQLCAKANAGTLPKRLEANQAKVIAACTTLQDPFGGLQATVTQAEQTFQNTLAVEKAKVQAVCPPATAAGRPACHAARVQARLADDTARLAQREAIQTYRDAVRTNRLTFWNTIASLRSSS
jgi:hypothetical protein